MKQQTLFLLLITLSQITDAHIRKIPAEVTEAFRLRYPHAEKVSWKDKITAFHAVFILNGHEMFADFSSRGEWQGCKKKIQLEDLSDDVKDGLSKSKYADWEKGSMVEIDKNGESLQYRIMVRKRGVRKKYLYFNTNGKLLKDALTL